MADIIYVASIEALIVENSYKLNAST